MHRDPLEANWQIMRAKAKEHWERLTEDDLDMVSGLRQRLIGRIQQRYGGRLDVVEQEVDRWIDYVDIATFG